MQVKSSESVLRSTAYELMHEDDSQRNNTSLDYVTDENITYAFDAIQMEVHVHCAHLTLNLGRIVADVKCVTFKLVCVDFCVQYQCCGINSTLDYIDSTYAKQVLYSVASLLIGCYGSSSCT